MGSYLNPGNVMFSRNRRSRIYVDKTGLIEKMNALIETGQNCVCVSRPRRFGKSMAANMLAAYYGRGVDSDALFCDLSIGDSTSYKEYLNRYNVIKLNMQEFLSDTNTVDEMLHLLKKYLLFELLEAYPDQCFRDEHNLRQVMKDLMPVTGLLL